MMESKYSIKHIGINNTTDVQAQALANRISSVFCLERTSESPTSIFVGSIFEVMKHNRRGALGHIAIQTPNVELAMADLAKKGITFQEDTIRRDQDGRIIFVYLNQEFGGFAIHLTV